MKNWTVWILFVAVFMLLFILGRAARGAERPPQAPLPPQAPVAKSDPFAGTNKTTCGCTSPADCTCGASCACAACAAKAPVSDQPDNPWVWYGDGWYRYTPEQMAARRQAPVFRSVQSFAPMSFGGGSCSSCR